MQEGVYIFEDSEDFIKVIEDLKDFVGVSGEWIRLSKWLMTLENVQKEINFLNKCEILTFSGFSKQKIIKVSLRHDNKRYVVTYLFKCSRGDRCAYSILHHYLRKREWE